MPNLMTHLMPHLMPHRMPQLMPHLMPHLMPSLSVTEEKKRHAMKQLQRAMDLKDERQLEAAIATYMDCNPAQGDELLAKARRLLEVLKIRGGQYVRQRQQTRDRSIVQVWR